MCQHSKALANLISLCLSVSLIHSFILCLSLIGALSLSLIYSLCLLSVSLIHSFVLSASLIHSLSLSQTYQRYRPSATSTTSSSVSTSSSTLSSTSSSLHRPNSLTGITSSYCRSSRDTEKGQPRPYQPLSSPSPGII